MAFNTKEFSWSNVEIAMLGRSITKARGVSYKATKEKEYLHARGENPYSIQSGNKAYEGQLVLLQSEVEAMAAQLEPDEDLTDLEPFSVSVSYVPKNGTGVITHTLENVEFTEDPREINQNDKFQEITLPIMFLGRKTR